jgi:hypothetical protein
MVFPIAARKTLAQTTVQCLLDLNPHPDQITTPSHMRSLMEIVGQAFDLPFEEDGTNVVASSLDVYRLWLCSATYQPSPVREDPEFFTSRMLRHISMVFRPRTGAIDRHIQIGRKALDVYAQVAKEAGPLFSAETWLEFLKLYLAVADSLLSQAVDAVPLADRLQGHVLRVLFEIWFLSGNQNEDVWGIFKSLFVNWRHRLATITAWTAVLFALVQRVIGITYGTAVGAASVTFAVGDQTVVLEMEDDHVMYLMYRVLHLVGDMETIKDPGIYNEAIRGLGFLMTALINVQSKVKGRGVVVPDGNTILHLLGPHMLEAITHFPRKMDHGKATAVEAVCKLFLRKANQTDFHNRYLAMFYHGLEAALKSGSGHLLSVVLTQCVRLFGSNFRGVNILMPSFVAAVTNVLSCKTQIQGVFGSMSLLRRSSLTLVMQLMCWPNHYTTLNFKTRDPLRADADSLPDIVSYEDMNPYLHHALIHGLESVTESQNHALLFNAAFLFIVENMDRDTSFAREFIADLLALLGNRKFPETSSIMDALRFFDDLSCLVQELNLDGTVSLPIVQTLCSVLSDALDVSVTPSNPSDELVCAALHCMHRWIDGPWIVAESELLHKVWSMLQICLSGGAGMHATSEQMQDAALYAAHHLLARVGHSFEPEFPTTTQREAAVLEQLNLLPSDMMCFMLDGMLFSLIKEPRVDEARIGVTVIMRSPAGTNSWRCALNYFPVPVTQMGRFDVDDTPSLPETTPFRTVSAEELERMNRSLTDDQRAVQEMLAASVEERLAILEEVRLTLSSTEVEPTSRLQRVPAPDGWDNVAARMFMATFGFLSRSFAGRVSVLPGGKMEDVLEFSGRFDALSARESYKVGLVYVPREAPSLMAECRECSPLFEQFVESLGLRAEVARHPEFELDALVVGADMVLACDADVAVAYVSPSWMPPDEFVDEQEAFLVSDLDVMVCWCEDAEEFRFKPKATYVVCIEPLPSGLYKVRIINNKTGGALPGPLVDCAVVSRYSLPMVLTRTVINMSRGAKDVFLYDQSIGRRREALEDFFREHIFQAPKLVQTWTTAIAKP